MHRDLKPANILITNKGVVKVGDLGLARIYRQPLQPLYNGDKVVVTIWYRAPELLLGARHYTPSVDVWAIGCIYAEMLSLRPMFKGEEARIDGKKLPFQRHQMMCIMDVLGYPNTQNWPGIKHMPEYNELQPPQTRFSYKLPNWFNQRSHSIKGFNLLHSMLTYDPEKRITAREALTHPFFVSEDPAPVKEPFVVYNQECIYADLLSQKQEIKKAKNVLKQLKDNEESERTRKLEEARRRVLENFDRVQQVGTSAKKAEATKNAEETALEELAKEQYEAKKSKLPSFWLSSLQPDSSPIADKIRTLENTKMVTMCRQANPPHPMSLKDLHGVILKSNKGDAESIVCASCNKTLNNSTPMFASKGCSNILCKYCIDTLYKAHKQCPVCDNPVKDANEDLIKVSVEGTGFAAGGGVMLKRRTGALGLN
ncbi:hypothetical protein E3Q13_04038 [Wallemia mellicola]|uniref:Cyclin-dependent kinase 8 n=1 Tax=Wallemia mellicola TaxID=1708541 RepID=A0AB38MQ85_9BASI|nr:hypothetical protein E3Q13_04038 [Wallemia mellicola]TIC61248.1 hypothetical protein E3Q02_03963 [Wallemia mellicola]